MSASEDDMMVCRVSCDRVLRKSVLYLVTADRAAYLMHRPMRAGDDTAHFLCQRISTKGQRATDSPTLPRSVRYLSASSLEERPIPPPMRLRHLCLLLQRCLNNIDHKHEAGALIGNLTVPHRSTIRRGIPLVTAFFSAAEAMNGEWKTCTMARLLRIRLFTA